MTIRGGGNPITAMAAMPLGEWTRRLGALPVEAYHCFMVAVPLDPTDYKRVARVPAHTGRLPSDHQSSRTRSLQHAAGLTCVKDKAHPGGAEKPAVLDRRCAGRLWHRAVGAEESRSNKRKGPRKRRKKEKVVLRPP